MLVMRDCGLRFCAVFFVFCWLWAWALPPDAGFPGTVQASEFPNGVVVSPCNYEGGGRFTSIALSPLDPRTVFVGSDVAGVFRSTDGGRTFQLKGKGLEGFSVADIAIHPENPRRIFILTSDGLYDSRDQGDSWQKENSAVRYESRQFGSRLMVFSKDGLWVAADRNGVFRVSFDASPWSAVSVPGLEKIKVYALANDRGVVVAGTEQGVFRFQDGRWQAFNDGLPDDHREVTDIVAHAEGRIYLVEKSTGPYVRDEGRKRWEARGLAPVQIMNDHPGAYKALAVHPRNPDILLFSTHPEVWPHLLYKSNDAGKSWKRVSSFQLVPEAAENFAGTLTGVEEIAFSPADPREVFLTDWSNVWRSGDEGEYWAQVHAGLQNTVVNAIRVHPADPRKIYLSVADNGLIVSRDGGHSWKRKMSGVPDGNAQAVEISRRDPERMYLLVNPWKGKGRVFVYKSSNGGETWEDAGFPLPTAVLPGLGFVDGLATNLVLDPGSDEVVYVGTNGYGIFKTVDGGKTWQAVNRGITTPFIKGPNAILIHPHDSRVLYASTLQGGVYKTSDGGGNWTAVSRGYPFTFGMAMDPSNPSRLFAGRPEKKIIVSEDGGKIWKEIRLPGGNPAHIASYAVAVHPSNPRLVVVGTTAYEKAADGVYVSRDGGSVFEKLPLDLPEINVLAVEIPGSREFGFFLGFNGIGAYRCEMPGMGK